MARHLSRTSSTAPKSRAPMSSPSRMSGVPRPEAMAASIGRDLGALQRTFTRRYAGLLASRDLAASPLPVFVFGSRARYNGWRRDSGALYLRLRAASEDKESTLDPIEEIRAVAWREGARQIVRALAPNGSRADGWDPWMDFGFFEYVGCYSRPPRRDVRRLGLFSWCSKSRPAVRDHLPWPRVARGRIGAHFDGAVASRDHALPRMPSIGMRSPERPREARTPRRGRRGPSRSTRSGASAGGSCHFLAARRERQVSAAIR